MKLQINQDFTKLPRAGAFVRAAEAVTSTAPFDSVVLVHDERHLRRRVVELAGGDKVLVDLPEPTALEDGDLLVLDDGRTARIAAADEEVYEITPRDTLHLAELCWHIGNRHLAAQIETTRILILRDHVIKAMLEGLGATITDIVSPFNPVRGAYSGHSHGHDHHHHGEADKFGRLPGDPHYGHNHA
ncbi:MAG: urease accessory protein UreE [Neoaquamicrobium sediminum]|uniref:urease accessory protein UreE n=1 Tax=Neoaquamicrobium sediminum TaxID=1849104 RepID=UPI004035A904